MSITEKSAPKSDKLSAVKSQPRKKPLEFYDSNGLLIYLQEDPKSI